MNIIAALLLSLLSEVVFAQGMSHHWIRMGAFESGPHRSLHLPVDAPRELEYALGALPANLASQAESAATQANRVTLALIEKGKVVFSKRRDGVHDTSLMVSYSMAKSLTAMMVGYAMCDGHINNLNERVDQYVPELVGTAYGQSTIRDILHMASGANASGAHGEPYWGFTSDLRDHKSSYMDHLQKYKDSKTRLFRTVKPGDEFDYKNLDTATLMLVIEKATQQPFHVWYEKTLVKGARLAHTSAWTLEKDRRAVAHALFFATPDDWLRLALHSLDAYAGRAGACLQHYMQQAVSDTLPIYKHAEFSRYGYQFWTGATGMNHSVFWMQGYGGQQIGIDPVTERLIVVASTDKDSSPFVLFRDWIKTKAQP